MAKTETYENELLRVIMKQKWMRWEHIDWQALSFSRKTAYNHKLHELHTIKSTFEDNRNKATNYLLQKWIASDNPTLQIAAMRIVAPEEDRRRLNQQYHEHEMKGQLVINTDEETKKNIERIRDD